MAQTPSKRLHRVLAIGCVAMALAALPARGQDTPSVRAAWQQARTAGLPEAAAGEVLAFVYDAGFDPAAAARTLAVLAEAHRDRFDLQPFHDLLQEGVAKQVDGNRIALALEDRLARQVRVAEGLRQRWSADASAADQAALSSLTDVLEMGLTMEELDALLQRAGEAPLTMSAVAAEMWALLKQINFAPALTDRIITEGLSRQTLHAPWRHFPQVVVIARQKGVPDRDTGAEALKSLQAGGLPADLLSRLGFTGRNLKTGPVGGD